MTTETMTIHEALCELKLLDKRIEDKLGSAQFVLPNKHSNEKIDGKTIKEVKDSIKADYTSISGLIKRRNAIKQAVIRSNAETEITIADKTMSVAEAIDYKNVGVEYISNLASALQKQLNRTSSYAASENDDLNDRADEYVIRLFGGKEKDVNAETIRKAKEDYINANTIDVIDAINAKNKIKELSEEVDGFNSKIDSALSVSNALTTIDVCY